MHWHKINKKGKTLRMTINPFRALIWLLRARVKVCHLPYRWFDRKRKKWRGDRYSHDGTCIWVN